MVDPRAAESSVAEAAQAIRAGQVVALATDTLYGLAANPFDTSAVAAIFAIKGRPDDRALPLIAADRAQAIASLGSLGPMGERLADRFWPGPLTLLIAAPSTLAAAVSAGTGRVGVRVPALTVARALCAACAMPLTATSANRSGSPPSHDPDVIAQALPQLPLLLDSGPSPGGPPSTIVDVTGEAPTLVRTGAIPWEEILACLR
jgi:L-threonylcarbamoyladenylate synthase